MQTIPKSGVLKSDVFTVRRSELALWAAALFAVCLSAVLNHRSTAATSDLRVVVADSRGSERLTDSVWRLDLNSASAQDLELLPGVGMKRAAAIVQERERRGGFSSVWELSEVPGLTPALIRRLEPLLQARPPAPLAR
jgi:competence ComEA-like helix-hairpin-helix protein